MALEVMDMERKVPGEKEERKKKGVDTGQNSENTGILKSLVEKEKPI